MRHQSRFVVEKNACVGADFGFFEEKLNHTLSHVNPEGYRPRNTSLRLNRVNHATLGLFIVKDTTMLIIQ